MLFLKQKPGCVILVIQILVTMTGKAVFYKLKAMLRYKFASKVTLEKLIRMTSIINYHRSWIIIFANKYISLRMLD